LAVCGAVSAVFGGILADNGLKVAVTFQLFCGFEGYSLSYIKTGFWRGLIHARLARPTALATAGVGKSHSRPVKDRVRWAIGRKLMGIYRCRNGKWSNDCHGSSFV